jgi:hypothetical protein
MSIYHLEILRKFKLTVCSQINFFNIILKTLYVYIKSNFINIILKIYSTLFSGQVLFDINFYA